MAILMRSFSLALCWALIAHSQTPWRAPDYAVQLLNGQKVALSSHLGKVMLLAFVNTDCPHCVETCRLMQRLQDEYGGRGAQMLAVAFDQRARQGLPKFIARSGAKFPVGFDSPEVLVRFLDRPRTAVYVPILVFIDRAGYIRGAYLGDDPFQAAKVQEGNIRSLLEKLLAEDPGRRPLSRF